MIILLLLLSLLHTSHLSPICITYTHDEAAYQPNNAQDAETNQQKDNSKYDQQNPPPRHLETGLT